MADKMEKISFLYLSHDDVLQAGLSMVEAMDLCTDSLTVHASGRLENPPKPGIHPLKDSFIHAMPASAQTEDLKVAGIKWVSGFPTNVPKGIPSVVGLIIMNDSETGYPYAILDGTYITAIRTAAVSGVTAKHFARQDSEVLAIIGTGVQGKYQTLCMLHLLKNLKTIKIYDTYRPSLDNYITQITPYIGDKIQIKTVSSFEEAMTDADVIIAATSTLHEAVMFDKWVKPGALVMPIHRQGWNADVLVNFDKFLVDDFNQFSTLMQDKYTPFPEAPYAELGEIVVGAKPGRETDQERIMCMNVGLGLYDVVVAAKMVEKAKAKGLGTELTLMDLTKTPPLPPIS